MLPQRAFGVANGSAANPIVITNYPDEQAIVKPSLAGNTQTEYSISIQNCAHIHIVGQTPSDSTDPSEYLFVVDGSADGTLSTGQIYNGTQAYTPGSYMRGYGGIQFYNSNPNTVPYQGATVENVYVHNVTASGININGISGPVTIRGCIGQYMVMENSYRWFADYGNNGQSNTGWPFGIVVHLGASLYGDGTSSRTQGLALIEDCIAGLCWGESIGVIGIEGFIVRRNRIWEPHRVGVYVDSSAEGLVQHNMVVIPSVDDAETTDPTFGQIWGVAVTVEKPTKGTNDVSVIGNIVYGGKTGIVVGWRKQATGQVPGRFSVHHNVVAGTSDYAITSLGSTISGSECFFSNNVFSKASGPIGNITVGTWRNNWWTRAQTGVMVGTNSKTLADGDIALAGGTPPNKTTVFSGDAKEYFRPLNTGVGVNAGIQIFELPFGVIPIPDFEEAAFSWQPCLWTSIPPDIGALQVPATQTGPIPPTITAIVPTSGYNNIVTNVTISGTGLTNTVSLSLDFTYAISVISIDSDFQVRGTVPSGITPGTYEVDVITTNGLPCITSATFTVVAPVPTVTSVSPSSGYNSETTDVTITGSGFTGATAVKLSNNTSLVSVFVVSATQILATVPSGVTPGTYDVRVTTPGGTNTTSSQKFTSVTPPVPVVSTVTPSSGVNNTTTVITIGGSGFSGATAVKLSNDTVLTIIAVDGPGQIRARVPTGVAQGPYYVRVTTPFGTNATGATFTVNNPPPVVSTVTPLSGYNNSTTFVTITGQYFAGLITVKLSNNTSLTGIGFTSTTITGFIPSGVTAGTYDIIVTTDYGANTTSAQKFTSLDTPAPTVLTVTPSSGLNNVTTNITLTGTNFTGATAVKFSDDTALTLIAIDSGGQIRARVPTGVAPGTYDVRVTTPYGTNSTSSQDFTVNLPPPVVSTVTPSSGENDSTTAISVTGQYLGSIISAKLSEDTALTSITSNTSTGFDAVVPSGVVAGTYSVVATTSYGSNTTSAEKFTVTEPPAPTPPEVYDIVPSSGVNSGTTPVVIYGSFFSDPATATINGVSLTSLVVNSSAQISATVPSGGTPGSYEVLVTTVDGSNTLSDQNFTVLAAPLPPTVTDVTPASGENDSTTEVTVTGTNFTGATNVALEGSVSFTSFNVLSATALTGIIPSGVTAGTYDVIVTGPGGSNTSGDTFTSVDPATPPGPFVSGVTPSSGVTPTEIVIAGSGFSSPIVSLDDLNETVLDISDSSDTEITATVPAGILPGVYQVIVTTPNGVDSSETFEVLHDVPTVTDVTPSSGDNDADTDIVVTGTHFVGTTDVSLDDIATTTLTFNVASDTVMTATVPGGVVPGTYYVIVTTPGGNNTVGDTFTVNVPQAPSGPTVDTITPNSGIPPTEIVIDGSDMTGGVVTINSIVLDVSASSDIQITCTVPELVAGVYNVVVTTSYGTDSGTFTSLQDIPIVSELDPVSGLTDQETDIIVTGDGFTGATNVKLDNDTMLAIIAIDSDEQLRATVPEGVAVGTYDVIVTTPFGANTTSGDQFTIVEPNLPEVYTIVPLSGPSNVSTSVVITGLHFTGALQAKIGSYIMTGLDVVSDTEIAATIPPGAIPASYEVIVTVPAGSNTLSDENFIVLPIPVRVFPEVSMVRPDRPLIETIEATRPTVETLQ